MLIPDYQKLWDSMIVNPTALQAVKLAATHIEAFKERYKNVAQQVNTTMPWYFVGLIHHMESGQSFDRHLHNGDPLTARTTHVPAGRPTTDNPPFTWEYSAIDALKGQGFTIDTDFSVRALLSNLEAYNGRGYRGHDIYSPYIWSKTNHYDKGYYTGDGKYDSNARSQQIGCAPILYFLINSDVTGTIQPTSNNPSRGT